MPKAASANKEKEPMTTGNPPDNDRPPSFEEAMTDLQQIVTDLEDNSLGLEASLVQFERGISLLRTCHAFLEQAEQKIEMLVNFKANGDIATAPFDAAPTAGNPEPKTLF